MSIKKLINIIIVHGSIVLGIIFLIFIKLDNVNPAMNFISSSQGKFLLFWLCVFSLLNALKAAKKIHMERVREWKSLQKEAHKKD